MSKNLLIYGPPASGKSTIGRKLAEMHKVQFIDLDEEIEERTGDPISKIINILGESGFRKVEADIFQDVVLGNENAIVALGGGTLLDEDSRKLAEAENTVICLELEQSILEKNFLNDKKERPLCEGDLNKYKKLLAERKMHYMSFETRVASAFLDPSPSEENGLSTIFIGKMLTQGVAALTSTLLPKAKIFVVYDKNVSKQAEIICKQLRNFAGSMALTATESGKSMKTIEKLLKKLDAANIARNDVVLSVGGGITSDISGFVSSIWKRGVRWVNVPTTLLSMVDASVGGKTGVNFQKAKNSVGAFHKPSLVFIDAAFLDTLPHKQMLQGYAEAYKHFLIDDSFKESSISVVETLKALEDPSDNSLFKHRVISKFLNTKLRVVLKDPFERNGEREKLNLGHTIAHAIEAKTNYKISHGEAVAIGIYQELLLAKEQGILKAKALDAIVANDLEYLGLPIEYPIGASWHFHCQKDQTVVQSLMQQMQKDKKNIGNAVKFILLEELHKTRVFSYISKMSS